MLVADLGADRVDEYAVEGTGADARLTLRASAQLPPGTGPRHMALKGHDLLVVGELDGHLHRFRQEGGNWDRLGAVPVVDRSNDALPLTDRDPAVAHPGLRRRRTASRRGPGP